MWAEGLGPVSGRRWQPHRRSATAQSPLDSHGPGRDRYVCGDDKLYPSAKFAYADDGSILSPAQSIEAFLNFDELGVRVVLSSARTFTPHRPL